MNDKKVVQQKIEMWTKKLADIKTEYEKIVRIRGEAAQMGDLRENAAFQDADEQSAVLSKRMADIEKIIFELEKELRAGKLAAKAK